jgi:hypothetical protein
VFNGSLFNGYILSGFQKEIQANQAMNCLHRICCVKAGEKLGGG